MNAVLQEFAKLTGAGPQRQIVLLIDGAGWHTSKKLQVPEGLHLHYLPAYSPELQPAERLWPPLRESVANESFETLSLLEERLQSRCRQLSSQRDDLRHLTHYHWWLNDREPRRQKWYQTARQFQSLRRHSPPLYQTPFANPLPQS